MAMPSRISRRSVLTALSTAAAATAAGCATRQTAVVQGRRSARFLLPPAQVFLNTGSLGASPEAVLDRTLGAWRTLELEPVHQGFGPLVAEANAVRERAAALLGATAADVTITNNTTDGMHLVAEGLALRPGDRVLTTDHEHPGGERCWQHAERERGVVLDRIRLPMPLVDPGTVVQLVAEALAKQPRTRVVSVSHVTSTTGTRLPIAAIAQVVRAHGAAFVVDGAQAPGAIRVDVTELGCDAYATSAHKWLLGPKGLGLLYIAPAARDRIRPARLADGPGVYTAAGGTAPVPAIVGLGAALELHEELGPTAIEAHNLALRERLIDGLRSVPEARLVSPTRGDLAAPMVAVAFGGSIDGRAVQRALRERHDVIVKLVPGRHFNGLRLSMHLYNAAEDVDRALDALIAELSPR